jgi:hypothetical protein
MLVREWATRWTHGGTLFHFLAQLLPQPQHGLIKSLLGRRRVLVVLPGRPGPADAPGSCQAAFPDPTRGRASAFEG